jgi:hypothetical protein
MRYLSTRLEVFGSGNKTNRVRLFFAGAFQTFECRSVIPNNGHSSDGLEYPESAKNGHDRQLRGQVPVSGNAHRMRVRNLVFSQSLYPQSPG